MQRLTASRVTSVLSKPFRLAELLAAVRTCLGRDPQ
jgi:DNA-binding response OmpR family regulator